jgi:DNA-binding transcriptional ArsR family regulator
MRAAWCPRPTKHKDFDMTTPKITLPSDSKMAQAHAHLYTKTDSKGGLAIANLAKQMGLTHGAATSLIGDLRRKGVTITKRRVDGTWIMYTTQQVAIADAPKGKAAPVKTKAPSKGKAAPVKKAPSKGKAA